MKNVNCLAFLNKNHNFYIECLYAISILIINLTFSDCCTFYASKQPKKSAIEKLENKKKI